MVTRPDFDVPKVGALTVTITLAEYRDLIEAVLDRDRLRRELDAANVELSRYRPRPVQDGDLV